MLVFCYWSHTWLSIRIAPEYYSTSAEHGVNCVGAAQLLTVLSRRHHGFVTVS